MTNKTVYNYIEPGYNHLGMHRKLIEFDPRNTNNEIILDAFNSIDDKNKHIFNLYQSMYIQQNESNFYVTDYPISFYMILFDINNSWNNIIKQMIFIDDMIFTFYSEYCNLLEKVINSDTMYKKEIVVFRYNDGGTIFHSAAKLLLLEVLRDSYNKIEDVKFLLNDKLTEIITQYIKLGTCFGKNFSNCIINLKDFSGKTLKQYLKDFCEELENLKKEIINNG